MSELDNMLVAAFEVTVHGMRRRHEDLKKGALRECDEHLQSAARFLPARLGVGNFKDLDGLEHDTAIPTRDCRAPHGISA